MPRRILIGLFALTVILPGRAAAQESTIPIGVWKLRSNQSPVTVSIGLAETGGHNGTLIDENGVNQKLDQIEWNANKRLLEFRRAGKGWWQWYRGTIVEGVFVGRFSQDAKAEKPVNLSAYTFHVTGWNSSELARLSWCVFNVILNDQFRAWLRIDFSQDKKLIGRLRIYSSIQRKAADEGLEYDLNVTKWDGTDLEFTRPDAAGDQHFKGTADGLTITGTYTQDKVKGTMKWKGTRAQVLSYGLDKQDPPEQKAWQERTRRQLYHLMMAGNPAPLEVKATVVQDKKPPMASKKYPADRDDNPEKWPQKYVVSEINLDATLPNPYGKQPLKRRIHVYMTVPTTPPPEGGYPALLAINGHGGSAWKMLNPDDNLYWYGDAFARRGYVVMAVDISHRPPEDTRGLYVGKAEDVAHGNGFHPAIKAPGFDSDWEEDGERAWDCMRALDYLLAQPNINSNHVVCTGLSMGGQLTTLLGGIEPRLSMSIPVAFSTDMGVMQYHGNHPCWRWINADIHEYIDTSDLYSLTAPRPLLIQVGKKDATYSSHKPPFTSDLQVLRRARVAYGTGPLALYLHYDGHRFHAGDVNPTRKTESGVLTPTLKGPATPGSLNWQTDAKSEQFSPTLFDAIESMLR